MIYLIRNTRGLVRLNTVTATKNRCNIEHSYYVIFLDGDEEGTGKSFALSDNVILTTDITHAIYIVNVYSEMLSIKYQRTRNNNLKANRAKVTHLQKQIEYKTETLRSIRDEYARIEVKLAKAKRRGEELLRRKRIKY
jgi:hypothetical protein